MEKRIVQQDLEGEVRLRNLACEDACFQGKISGESETNLPREEEEENQLNPLKQFVQKQAQKTAYKSALNLLGVSEPAFSKKQQADVIKGKLCSTLKKENQLCTSITKDKQQVAFSGFNTPNARISYNPIRVSVQNFIKTRNQPLKDFYDIQEKIGEGGFGSVYKAICKSSDEPRAIKVLKNKTMGLKERQKFMAEIKLLKRLDHPHIIKLYDIFSNNNTYYVVTEFCEGGSVVNLVKKHKFPQKAMTKIMKQLLSAVSYLHQNLVVHRDIKLDNIVMLKPASSFEEDGNLNVKLIDFGLAIVIQKPHQLKKTDPLGTVHYMAPQIINKFYNEKCDIWSCGIVFYKMLMGKYPFKGHIEQVMRKILDQKIQFQESSKEQVNQGYKDLILRMLNKDHRYRISALSALQHPCFEMHSENRPRISAQAIQNLSSYYRGNNLITVIESYLSYRNINQIQRQEIASIFKSLDRDGNGTIDISELINIYRQSNGTRDQNVIKQIVEKIDHNKSGKIDFNEFLVAMYSRRKLFDHKSLEQAFDYFDVNHTGYLEKCEIKQALKGCQKQQVRQLIQKLDKDGDQKVSKQEFLEYLQNYQELDN